MGSLRDELKKWFAGAGNRGNDPAKLAKSAQAIPQVGESAPEWKRGVNPLDAPGATTVPALRSKQAILRLPSWTMKRRVPAEGPVASSLDASAKPASTTRAGAAAHSSRPMAGVESQSKAAAHAMDSPSMLRFGEAKQPVLSREKEFKFPEEWVASGAALQAPDGGAGRILSVRVGLDFGTAYTKAAIRIADKVFFVPWSGIRDSDVRYFLPGELCRLVSDSLWLGRAPSAAEVRSDLKLPFLANHESSQAQQAAAMAFLALALRYVRAWLYRAHPSIVSGRKLVWELNLGCPTNSWSSGNLKGVYEGIAARAWQLSQEKNVINWEETASRLAPLNVSLEDLGLDGLHLMPEFVAQIAGYVRSPQRRNGLHMLMDVGAGTVDLATFNVAYDSVREEDRYPIFASEVLPLGTHFLMATRLRSLGREQGDWDDLQAIPAGDELANRLNADRQRLENADREFSTRLRAKIRSVLSYTRAQRYGKAPEWREGLPIFLCGGGSDCDIYSRALATSCAECKVPHRRTSFPLLDEAATGESFDSREFHRLSVAYGLTFDAESIGRILAPHEVDDAPAYDPLVDVPRERPDRDELYPK